MSLIIAFQVLVIMFPIAAATYKLSRKLLLRGYNRQICLGTSETERALVNADAPCFTQIQRTPSIGTERVFDVNVTTECNLQMPSFTFMEIPAALCERISCFCSGLLAMLNLDHGPQCWHGKLTQMWCGRQKRYQQKRVPTIPQSFEILTILST